MIGVQDLRPGVTFQLDGQPFVVLKYEHIKMGRGSATIKIKMRGLKSGVVVEKSFINNARVEEAEVVRKQMQYLYNDGASLVFMDPKSFEQVEIPNDVLSEQAAYLTEGIVVWIQFYEDKAIGMELPLKMNFKIVECDPGVKGDSASNMYKAAILENGVTVKVPLFVNEGEVVVIDTRNGDYVERAK